MSMKTEADAFACLAVLVAGIDGLGTMEEREFLFGTLAGLPPFKSLDRSQFSTLLSDASGWVYDARRGTDGGLTDEGVSDLLDQICERVSPERHAQAFQMAMDLARADDLAGEEQRLVDRLRTRLLPQT